MSRRDLSIIFVPHDRGYSRTVRTSYRQVKAVGIVIVVCLVAVAGVVGHYTILLKRVHEMEALRSENRVLRGEVERIEELRHRLESYESYVSKINTILGVSTRARGDSAEAGAVEGTSGARAERVETVSHSAAQALTRQPVEREIPSEWPLTCRGFITRGYTGESVHPGIDIAAPMNTPVRATASGRVSDLGCDHIYGNYIEIQHGESYSTVYGHNASVVARVGQWVGKGEIIAYSGNSGRSTAPHLHYEVRCKGVAVDPQPYLLEYRREGRAEG